MPAAPVSSHNSSATVACTFAAVVALGVSAGAMLTEAAVFAPYWRSLPPADFLTWFAANTDRLFNFYGPLEIATTALTLAAAALARRRPGGGWMIAAAVLSLAVLALFPLYFQAANESFAARTIAVDTVGAELERWSAWQWLRTAIGLAAFAAALRAVTAQRA